MSKIIQAGIASYGMSGKIFHAPFLQQHPNYNLKAIVERHKNESRERYPGSLLYRSFEELIADDDIDLVIVNTPVQTHFEYAKAALQAGKNIVVEKPFTTNASEAAELNALAKEKGLFLSVYQNRRYDGDFKALQEVLDENLLGELKEAEMRFDRYRPGHSGKEHKEGDKPGAGNLHDLGAHLIDQAIQLFGFPEAVWADVFAMRKDMIANDYFELILYYPKPFRVRIKGTVFCREPYYAYILQGENGTFMQERSDLQELRLSEGAIPALNNWIETPDNYDGILHSEINGFVVKRQTRSGIGNYMNYYQDVYDALVNGKPNPVPASDAVLTMKVVDAALESSSKRCAVNLKKD
ncbi:MAG: Gfo/Idh/MocA family oxidoreductase [Niabella sp.]